MKRKRILTLIIVVLLIGVVLYCQPAKSKYLTFKEAYAIASREAKSWNIDALLLYSTSVDKLNETDELLNGKRKNWNFEFAIPESKSHYVVEIEAGNITFQQQLSGQVLKKVDLIVDSDILHDSTYFLISAQDNYNLLPGKSWANGYHFVVFKIDNKTTMTVYGTNDRGEIKKITFDMQTCEVIRQEE